MHSERAMPTAQTRVDIAPTRRGVGRRAPSASATRPVVVAVCRWCETHPDAPCPACASRRRRAVRLVLEQRHSVAEAARVLRLSVERVERLLEEDADRRRLAQFAGDSIDTARLRALLLARQHTEPELTTAALARRLSTSQAQLERWLGLRATTPKTSRSGRRYPARELTEVGVEVAGRIVQALGYAPCEIDGL